MLSYKRSLSLKLFSEEGQNNDSILNYLPNAPCFFSGSVRSGIFDIIDSLKIKKNDYILAPSFIAHGLILPFKRRGIEVLFYKLNSNLGPDIENVTNLISSNSKKIRLLLFIHYFGFYQDSIVYLKKICAENDVIIFEDCVHGLFTTMTEGKPMGSVGDISCFSLPKALPVPDGSLFFVNNTSLSIQISYRYSLAHRLSSVFHFYYLILKRVHLGLNNKLLSSFFEILCKVIYLIYYSSLCQVRHNTKPSRTTLKLLDRIDYKCFINRKQAIYSYYEKNLTNSSHFLRLPFDVSSIPVASGFPLLYISNIESLKKGLKVKGIEVLTYTKYWNFIPKGGAFTIEKEIFSNHILLPINHEFTNDQVDYIVKNVNLLFTDENNN